MISPKTVADVFSTRLPARLYHYTDQVGFLGIVGSAKLWASKIQYLNDREEFALALRVATEVIDERLTREADDDRREKLLDMRMSVENIEDLNICVCSLSEARNQLSQWRAYGGGSGFSLGFEAVSLQKLVSDSWNYRLMPCVYDPPSHRSLVVELVEAELGDIAPATEAWGPIHPGLGFEANVATLASVVKHQGFEEEREWRLVSRPLHVSNLHFRAGVSMPIPYGEFSLSSETAASLRDVLVEVLVGPSPNQALGLAATQTFLLKHGITKPIAKASDIPFRSW